MSRSETKPRDPGARFRVSAIPEGPFRGRRSASVDNNIKQTMVAYKRSSSGERKSGSSSYSRYSGSRKSSIGGYIEGKISQKDPRPLSDKSYLKKKATEIMTLLQTDGNFVHPITVSRLMQPMKKDFEIVFQYLVNFIDPAYEVKKLEEEAPKILKSLFYAYIPNKNAFLHCARSCVPSLMGVLIFLADLVQFLSNVDRSVLFQTGESERPEEHAILLQYCMQCYMSQIDDEDSELQMFTNIINSRTEVNVHELQEQHALKNENVARLQKELEHIESLQMQLKEKEFGVQQYKDYFAKMQVHMDKRKNACEQLSEDLHARNSTLAQLRSMLGEKQAAYEAQGFDGRKHMQYLDEQKRELQEKLQQSRAQLKLLQGEAWDTELQHAQGIDKSKLLCEQFNRHSSSFSDVVASLVASLERLRIPAARNLLQNQQLDQLPQLRMTVGSNGNVKRTLEEVKRKGDTCSVFLKGMQTSHMQALRELIIKKSELSMNVKVASAEESQHERDICSIDKQALEETHQMEVACEERIVQLEKVRQECRRLESNYEQIKTELARKLELNASKQKQHENYVAQQKKFYQQQKSYLDGLRKQIQVEHGMEISAAFDEVLELAARATEKH